MPLIDHPLHPINSPLMAALHVSLSLLLPPVTGGGGAGCHGYVSFCLPPSLMHPGTLTQAWPQIYLASRRTFRSVQCLFCPLMEAGGCACQTLPLCVSVSCI